MNVKLIGERLRELRGGRPVYTIAAELSMSPVTISLYENGKITDPSVRKLYALASYYNTTIEELINHE